MRKIKIITVDNKKRRFLIIAAVSCIVVLAAASIVLLALDYRKDRKERNLVGIEQRTFRPESFWSDVAESDSALDSFEKPTASVADPDKVNVEEKPYSNMEIIPRPEINESKELICSKWENVKSFYLYSERGFDYLLLTVGSILFLLFLLCWRLSSRDRRPKIIKETITKVVEPGPEYLKKEDVIDRVRKDYVNDLCEKYDCYVPEGTETFIRWVYDRIENSNDFPSASVREVVKNQLRWGFIENLERYDYLVSSYKSVIPGFAELAELVFEENQPRAVFNEDQPRAQELSNEIIDEKKGHRQKSKKNLPEFNPCREFEEECKGTSLDALVESAKKEVSEENSESIKYLEMLKSDTKIFTQEEKEDILKDIFKCNIRPELRIPYVLKERFSSEYNRNLIKDMFPDVYKKITEEEISDEA